MITAILSLIFVGFGFSLVVGGKSGGKWFLKTTKNAAMAPVKAVGKTAKAQIKSTAGVIWKKYKGEIISLGCGIGFMEMAFQLPPYLWFWPLAVLLLFLAGWLIGLAIASSQGRQDEYVDACKDAVYRAAKYMFTNHLSKIIWFAVGMAIYIVFPGPHR